MSCWPYFNRRSSKLTVVAKAIKDLANKLEVPLEFSDFPPPQSSVALSSVVNANQWEEAGGVIASTITPNCHWPFNTTMLC